MLNTILSNQMTQKRQLTNRVMLTFYFIQSDSLFFKYDENLYNSMNSKIIILDGDVLLHVDD